jgi:hypothetical protein
MKVVCLKCGRNGSLTQKTTVSKGKKYRYFYVEHSTKGKNSWCYVGRNIQQYTQIHTQTIHKLHTQTEVLKNSQNEVLFAKSIVRGVGFEPSPPW